MGRIGGGIEQLLWVSGDIPHDGDSAKIAHTGFYRAQLFRSKPENFELLKP